MSGRGREGIMIITFLDLFELRSLRIPKSQQAADLLKLLTSQDGAIRPS